MAKSDISTQEGRTTSQLGTTQTQASNVLNQAIPGYRQFAATGGISPTQQNLTMKGAQSNVAAIYDALQRNLQRRNAIQGGYNPGFGANMSSLARGSSASSADAVNQSQLGLLNLIQQGKLAGIGGLTDIGSLYQSQIPQLLGIGSNLAMAKPGWMDLARSGFNLFKPILSAIGGGMGGGGAQGAFGAL